MKCQCKICGKTPDELTEYVCAAITEDMTPTEFVISEEGTFNPRSGNFYCSPCYVKIGMPLGKA